MTKIQKNILKKVAAVGKLAAIKAAGAASWADCYQPKEPKSLKKGKWQIGKLSNRTISHINVLIYKNNVYVSLSTCYI